MIEQETMKPGTSAVGGYMIQSRNSHGKHRTPGNMLINFWFQQILVAEGMLLFRFRVFSVFRGPSNVEY